MNENDHLIESLLQEHAKMKREGVSDEKFLREVEMKLDEVDALRKGVFATEVEFDSRSEYVTDSKGYRRLMLWAAASLVIGVGGYAVWNQAAHRDSQHVALGSEVVEQQLIERSGIAPRDSGFAAVENRAKKSREKSEVVELKPEAIVKNDAEAPIQPKAIQLIGRDLKPQAEAPSFRKVASPLKKGRSMARLMNSKQRGNTYGFRPELDRRREYMVPNNVYPLPQGKSVSSERYGDLVENQFMVPIDKETKRSTFAVDVDTASYANLRRMIQQGATIPKSAVRIEELVNYFDYSYPQPQRESTEVSHPFAVQVDAMVCPWNAKNQLVRVAIQAKEVARAQRPAANLVFLIDVSGSMRSSDKLPLLKESMKYLLEELNEDDSVSIAVYAGAAGLALPATKVTPEGRLKILKAFDQLQAGGSTAGGQGIKLAYQVAKKNYVKGGVNRVILATDGDFNVGVHNDTALTSLVKEKAKSGVYLSVLGFGRGNLNDKMLESITNNGNGNYNYIDSLKEGRKVLLDDMMGTLVTIAKDVKVQVEMNPNLVKQYRLIGYANRILPNAAFLDKKADAGEIGAGHTVTAFYEIVPGKAQARQPDSLRYAKKDKQAKKKEAVEVPRKYSDEILFVKLAYKLPQQKLSDESTYFSEPLKNLVKPFAEVDSDFKFASSVALFGMLVGEGEFTGEGDLEMVLKLAEAGKGADGKGLRAEFIQLVKKMKERR